MRRWRGREIEEKKKIGSRELDHRRTRKLERKRRKGLEFKRAIKDRVAIEWRTWSYFWTRISWV